MQLIKSMLTTCEFYTCKKNLKINIFVHLKKKVKMSYFNLFIQKGMFHSHTCIQIITIDGRTFDLEKIK